MVITAVVAMLRDFKHHTRPTGELAAFAALFGIRLQKALTRWCQVRRQAVDFGRVIYLTVFWPGIELLEDIKAEAVDC
ncbi:hypothetical protein D3C75_1183910 [compost metagenome]